MTARRKKETTYPELALRAEGRARLVVLAAEVGGRWSNETSQFLRGLAKARAETVPMTSREGPRLRVCADGALYWRAAW